MAAPTFDSNTWYQLFASSGDGQGLIGSVPKKGDTQSGVWFNPTNTSLPQFRWQIFQLNSTTWLLRNNISGPNAYLGAGVYDAEDTVGKTRPCLARGDVADASAYWTFSSWGDDTWYMWNAANGTDLHMNKKGSGTMSMSPNITAPQPGQRWRFSRIDSIDDVAYSSVGLVSKNAPSSSPTSTSTNPPPSSSGLSTGAQAAIGASIGGVAIIALVILGLFLIRRKKQRQVHGTLAEAPRNDANTVQAPPLKKYEMYHDRAAKHEMPVDGMVEAPINERPAELPGQTVQR